MLWLIDSLYTEKKNCTNLINLFSMIIYFLQWHLPHRAKSRSAPVHSPLVLGMGRGLGFFSSFLWWCWFFMPSSKYSFFLGVCWGFYVLGHIWRVFFFEKWYLHFVTIFGQIFLPHLHCVLVLSLYFSLYCFWSTKIVKNKIVKKIVNNSCPNIIILFSLYICYQFSYIYIYIYIYIFHKRSYTLQLNITVNVLTQISSL